VVEARPKAKVQHQGCDRAKRSRRAAKAMQRGAVRLDNYLRAVCLVLAIVEDELVMKMCVLCGWLLVEVVGG
jgi:hypothetical protein